VNWSSSMALITLRCMHLNNWFVMCTRGIGCLWVTFSKDFGRHPNP
jgi:hypothetical protein